MQVLPANGCPGFFLWSPTLQKCAPQAWACPPPLQGTHPHMQLSLPPALTNRTLTLTCQVHALHLNFPTWYASCSVTHPHSPQTA
jgi:hypothetical protein